MKVSFIIHILYIFIGLFFFFFVYNQTVDFVVFYRAGQLIHQDPNAMYDVEQYYLPFRYLPFAAFLFSILSVLNLPIGVVYVFFTLASFAANILVAVILSELVIDIYKLPKEYYSLFYQFLGAFFLYVPHADNYVNGQINSFLGLALIGALYFFEKAGGVQTDDRVVANCVKLDLWKYNLIGGILLGLATVIKPSAFVLLPFVVIAKASFNKQTKKVSFTFNISQTLVRLLGAFLFLLPSIYIFNRYPLIWKGFLAANFSGGSQLIDAHSFSFTRIIINIFMAARMASPNLLIFVVISAIFFGFAFLKFLFRPEAFEYQYQYRYFSIALTALLVSYFDSWGHHLISWAPIAIILVIFAKVQANNAPVGTRQKKIKEYEQIYYVFGAMGAMLWTLLYYLTSNVFYEGSPGFNIIYCGLTIAFYFFSIRTIEKEIKE
jgi:hypothetical protein